MKFVTITWLLDSGISYKRDLNGRVMDREMESNKSLHSNKQVCKIGLRIQKNT